MKKPQTVLVWSATGFKYVEEKKAKKMEKKGCLQIVDSRFSCFSAKKPHEFKKAEI